MSRGVRGPWVKRVVAAVGIWAFTLVFASFTDRSAHALALAAATAAVLTIVWLCTDVFEHGGVAEWSLYRAPAPDRTFDPRFSRLSQQLDEDSDRPAVAKALHASLNAVADRLLADKYDVDRAQQPDAARELLGPQTWSYLETGPAPGTVVLTPQLFDALDTLESL